MSDLKSKLPDIHELGSMASKLFKDIKVSIEELIHGYKTKHSQPASHQVATQEKTKDKAPSVKKTTTKKTTSKTSGTKEN